MPKAVRRIVVADSEEELDALTAQRPGEKEPVTPVPSEPQPKGPPGSEPEDPGTLVPGRRDPNDDDGAESDPNDPEEPETPAAALPGPANAHLTVIEGEILARHVKYESRISILDAFQYPGSVRDAPSWVDKNWVGYADFDPVRMIEPGPCLRIPSGSGVVLVRIGDYVARQEVRLDADLADVRLEAWDRDQFERLFLPVRP